MAVEFNLPNLGENIEAGDIINVLVEVGDRIEEHQPVLELETDKAVVEVPVPFSGIVEKVHVKSGERAEVGQLVLTVAQGKVDTESAPETEAETLAESPAEAAEVQPEVSGEEPAPAAEQQRPAATTRRGRVVEFNQKPRQESARAAAAAPSVRRLAREIGIDIGEVHGSGPSGRISDEDVKAHARNLHQGGGPSPASGTPGRDLPDFSRWGDLEMEAFSNVRRATARHMAGSWASIPHVTQHDRCDITGLEERRRRLSARVEAAGGKLTVTAIVLKVLAAALRKFPQFNASIDTTAGQIIYKKYIHIGVAVDTPRGLLVPVVRDVDQKNIVQLAIEIKAIAEKTRAGKVSPDDLQGGTFTVTNLGGIGGTSFTPIVNWPEVAILGLSRSRVEPEMIDGQFVPRTMLPLSLSYDHRLIDGADAARFLRWVGEALEDPFLVVLEG